MKIFHKITTLALFLTSSLILIGCGGGSSSSTTASTTPTTTSSSNTSNTTSSTIGQGKLSVHLTDAPAEYEAVYVTIAEVLVHREGTDDDNDDVSNDDSNDNDNDDGEWIVVATPNITYNLLELQNGITTFMGEELIPSGDYTQLRLVLGSTPDAKLNILGNPHPEANYIILDDDLPYALKVPSNTVKYNHNFTLIDGGDVDMVIDFDAEKSIHPAGDKWILNPVLKVKTELQ